MFILTLPVVVELVDGPLLVLVMLLFNCTVLSAPNCSVLIPGCIEIKRSLNDATIYVQINCLFVVYI